MLKNKYPSDPQYAKMLLIEAHSYFNLRQYKQALSIFESLVKIGKPYSENAEWNSILCLLADFSIHKLDIKNRLNKISSTTSNTYYEKAKELKEKISLLNNDFFNEEAV